MCNQGEVYFRNRKAFLTIIISFFIVVGLILDIMGGMGASMTYLSYRLCNPVQPFQNRQKDHLWPKIVLFGVLLLGARLSMDPKCYSTCSQKFKGDFSINTSLAKNLHNYVLILAEKIIFLRTQYFRP